MNTSDQSLFPMDSAFKRRWDWEYIPICYDNIPENESFGYEVIIDEKHSFKWIDFIKNINAVIKSNPNLGMDKCIGNYFIKSNSKEITLKEFINKAIFYLWNDVFKDETYHQDTIFVQKNDDGTKIKDLSFNDFHKEDNQDDLLLDGVFFRIIAYNKDLGLTLESSKEEVLAAYSNLVTTKAPYWTTIITEKGFIKEEITIELLYQ